MRGVLSSDISSPPAPPSKGGIVLLFAGRDVFATGVGVDRPPLNPPTRGRRFPAAVARRVRGLGSTRGADLPRGLGGGDRTWRGSGVRRIEGTIDRHPKRLDSLSFWLQDCVVRVHGLE